MHPVFEPDDQSHIGSCNFNKILCPDILPNIRSTTPRNDVVLYVKEQY